MQSQFIEFFIKKGGCIFLSGVILMNIELALDISEC